MKKPSVLFMLTYILRQSIPLIVARDLRDRGVDAFISYYVNNPAGYTQDNMDDFRETGRLVDLSVVSPDEYQARIAQVIDENGIKLVVQIGCEPMYSRIPYILESRPHVRLVDMLFNDVGHVRSHFIFENCIHETLVESEVMANYIRRVSAKPDPRVRIINTGVDVHLYTAKKRPIAPGALTVGYIGRMSPEKNPKGFVELAERLHPLVPEAKFVMYGQGPEQDAVREACETSRAGKAIEFHGFSERLEDAMQAIDVLVVPSLVDGRPTAIMEANGYGLPVIGTPIGAIPELIEDGVNGHICKLSDTDRFAGILRGWMEKPGSLTEMSVRARKIAEDRFARHVMLQQWYDIVHEYDAD